MIVTKRDLLIAMLTQLSGVGGALNGALMHLYKTAVPLSPDMAVADFTEADFTGYAASTAIAWRTPGYDSSHNAEMFGGLKDFFAGSPLTVTNVVYGYYVTDGTGANLLFAEAFSSPVSVVNPGQIVAVIPRYAAGQIV